MNSTAAVIATNTSLSSLAAMREGCGMVLQNFDNYKPTVIEMREYATCVKTLYPDPISGAEVIALKVVIVLCIVAAVVGAFKGARQDGWPMAVFMFCSAPIIVIAFSSIAWLLYFGIAYVFGINA